MKVLVTGGAGYIGSHATMMLLDRGYDVVVLDSLITGHLEAIDKRAIFYKGDIGDYDLVCKIIKDENITAVMHFAAFSLVGESMVNPYKYFANNVGKTNVLLKAITDTAVPYLVFSSTAAVYGEPKVIPIVEENELKPTNVYGETKVAMEKMIRCYANTFPLRYVSLRYFNVCGASKSGLIGEAHNPETHLIPIILEAAKSLRPYLPLYGNDYPTKDGTCIRDYIHVVDLCSAHILALEYLIKGGVSDIFNLGSGNGFSNLELIASAKKITGVDFPVHIENRRIGDPAVLIASSSKAQAILGWKKEYDNIDEMITDAWNWSNHKRY